MSKIIHRYRIIREYKNHYDTKELMKRIIRIHIHPDILQKTVSEHTDQEENAYEEQFYG